eukprot:11955912-Ditylum_brightwellii.AAC.1
MPARGPLNGVNFKDTQRSTYFTPKLGNYAAKSYLKCSYTTKIAVLAFTYDVADFRTLYVAKDNLEICSPIVFAIDSFNFLCQEQSVHTQHRQIKFFPVPGYASFEFTTEDAVPER